MSKQLNVSLSLSVDEGKAELFTRAVELLTRTAVGLCLDGLSANISVSHYELSEEEIKEDGA